MENKKETRKKITDKIELVDFVLKKIDKSDHGWITGDIKFLKFGTGFTFDDNLLDVVALIIKQYTQDSEHKGKVRGTKLNEKGLELIKVHGSYRNFLNAEKRKNNVNTLTKIAISISACSMIAAVWFGCNNNIKDKQIEALQKNTKALEDSIKKLTK